MSKLIDLFKKIGLFVERPYSNRYNGNLLGVELWVNFYDGRVWHNTKVDEILVDTYEGINKVAAVTFKAEAKQVEPVECSDEEWRDAMNLIGGY